MNPLAARSLFLGFTAAGLIWSFVAVPVLGLPHRYTTSRAAFAFFSDRPLAAFLFGALVMVAVRDGWSEGADWFWLLVLVVGCAGLGHILWPMWMD